jgi:RimJ/RimL family protein N-acetyltransferase
MKSRNLPTVLGEFFIFPLPPNLTTRTKRLTIRPFKPTDYRAWKQAHDGAGPKQNSFDSLADRKPQGLDKDSFDDHVLGTLADFSGETRHHVLGIFTRDTGENVGEVDLFIFARGDWQWGNIGYRFHSQYWGHGYATEATRAGLRLGFDQLGLHRIEAAIERGNKASINVAKKCGMERECVRRRFASVKNSWIDCVIYVAIADD